MVLSLTLNPETEKKLTDLARANGTTVEEIARAALERLEPSISEATPTLKTPEERAKAWQEWADSHPRREGVHLDDSRESIYAGRGE